MAVLGGVPDQTAIAREAFTGANLGILTYQLVAAGVISGLDDLPAYADSLGIRYTVGEDGVYVEYASADAVAAITSAASRGAAKLAGPRLLRLNSSGHDGDTVTRILPWSGPGLLSLGIPQLISPSDPGATITTLETTGMTDPATGDPVTFTELEPGYFAGPSVMLAQYQFLVNVDVGGGTIALTVDGNGSDWAVRWVAGFQLVLNDIEDSELVEP